MLIDQITEKARALTEKQQEDVLRFIQSLYEPREYARSSQRLEIDSVVGDRVIQSDTRDISAGGAFVNTNATLALGSEAMVVFSIPGQNRPFKLHSKVVRTEKEGVGIQFNKMSVYSRRVLDDVLSGSGDGDWLSGSTLKIEVS